MGLEAHSLLWGLTWFMFTVLVMTLVMTKVTAYDSASKRLRGKMGREFESGKME